MKPSPFKAFWATLLGGILLVPQPLFAATWDLRFQQLDGSSVARQVTVTATANSVVAFAANQTVVSKQIVAGANVTVTHNNTAITVAASTAPTTNASDLTSGTLAVGRLPATTLGTVTSTAGTGNYNVVASGVTAGVYGNATRSVSITVLADGRISNVTESVILGSGNGTGNVTASGTLTGNATEGNIIVGNGGTDARVGNLTWTHAGNGTLTVGPGGNGTIIAGTANFTVVNAGNLVLGNVIDGAAGGTGAANTGKTITLGGNLTTTGAFNTNLIVSVAGNYTMPEVDAKLGFRGIPWVVANANVTTNATHNGKGLIAETLGNNTTTVTLNRTQAATDSTNGGFALSVFNAATTNSITVTASSGNIILVGSGNLTGGTSAIVAPGGLATFTLANATLIVSGSNVTVP